MWVPYEPTYIKKNGVTKWLAKDVMFSKIEKILEVNVRPKLAEHYGNIELVSVEDGIVEVKLLGNVKDVSLQNILLKIWLKLHLKKLFLALKR